jgi:hypothetical protein
MGEVIVDEGTTETSRIILVQDYLDRYPDALLEALATATATVPSRIRFWMQTHQTIDLDGVGTDVANWALNQGHITQAQHDEILA